MARKKKFLKLFTCTEKALIRRKLILEFVKHCNVVEDAFKIYRHVNLSQEEAVKRGEFGVMDRKYFRSV